MKKQSLITDIKEVQKEKDNIEDTKGVEKQNQLPNEDDFTIDSDDSAFDQYANMHGKLITRVARKLQLVGHKLDEEGANYLAHTIQNVMQQEILFGIMEYMDIDSIEDLLPEGKQDEIVNMFGSKDNLDVSPEDMEKLKEEMSKK